MTLPPALSPHIGPSPPASRLTSTVRRNYLSDPLAPPDPSGGTGGQTGHCSTFSLRPSWARSDGTFSRCPLVTSLSCERTARGGSLVLSYLHCNGADVVATALLDTRCLGLVPGALCTHYKKLTSSGLRLGIQQLALVVRTRFGYAFRRPLWSVGGRRCRGCLGQLSSLKTGLVRCLALFRLGNGWRPWWRVRTPRPLSFRARGLSSFPRG